MLKRQRIAIVLAVWLAVLTPLTLFELSISRPHNNSHSQGATDELHQASQAEIINDRIATYTLWLAIFTGALFFVSAIQIRFLIRADRASRLSGITARRSANAARKTVETMERTAERQLRAYIAIDDGAVIPNSPAIGKISAFVAIKNYRATPAYSVLAWSRFAIEPADQPPFANTMEPVSNAILGPGSIFDQTNTLVSSPDQISDIQAGRKKLYVWGRVDYIDAFGKPRWFKYRCSMSREQGTVDYKSVRAPGWGLTPEPDGTEAN